VKQNKKAKICFVIHIAGEKKLLFYFYFVIVKQNFINGPLITTLSLSLSHTHTKHTTHMYVYIHSTRLTLSTFRFSLTHVLYNLSLSRLANDSTCEEEDTCMSWAVRRRIHAWHMYVYIYTHTYIHTYIRIQLQVFFFIYYISRFLLYFDIYF
jgi:hypothetical protein